MINKNEVSLLAQIFDAMEDAAVKLEEASKEKNSKKFDEAKAQLLTFQKRIDAELGGNK